MESLTNQSVHKRKRGKSFSAERQAQEQLEAYNKLVYSATKDLKKQAKVAKTFELQKLIRKLKSKPASSTTALDEVKSFPLEPIVQECMRRLGIYNLNPKIGTSEDSTLAETPSANPELVERILRHKRIVTALEQWNEKVTKYRRWCLQSNERKPTKLERKQVASSVFVSLGSDPEGSHYGPASDSMNTSVPKNRPGQRARRAKAMALQAKKEGRTYDHSINWRAPKKKRDDSSEIGNSQPSSNKEDSRTTNEKAQEEHPSWTAAKTQKANIVEFKGTKITF